jgi:rRNA maturation RNase YbeY
MAKVGALHNACLLYPIMPIIFSEADVRPVLKSKRQLKAKLLALCEAEGHSIGTLSYVFCSDGFLLELNLKFLNHNTLTDIITFDLSESPSKAIEGEVYISVDRVRENALELNEPFDRELLRVVYHGVLHLCGYKDKSKSDKKTMRAMEDHYLETL